VVGSGGGAHPGSRAEDIVAALEAGDPEAARAAASEHIFGTVADPRGSERRRYSG
jgi:DNA-binding GntR family transcriptional regulator